jgi:hypothetical protein
MAVLQLPTSLFLALSNELAIEITSHLATTSERPMDDLRSLRVTCSSMHRICGNPAISRRLSLVQFRCRTTWDNPMDYEALLDNLTQLGNLGACFFIGI